MENLTMARTTALALQSHFGNESTPAVTTALEDRSWYPLYLTIKYMRHVGLPAIFFLGTFGNIMTILITQRKSFEKSVINIYFTAVAVSDMIFLPSVTLPWWLGMLIGYDVMTTHVVLCKLHTWLYSVAGTSSCWCLVSMTVHRSMSVIWPHRVNLLCTQRKVHVLLTGILIFMMMFYSHYIVWLERVPIRNGRAHVCVETDQDYKDFFSNVFVYLELVVYSVLPFLILVVSNTVLVWKLYISVKTASRHLTGGDSEARAKAANSVTVTVVVVSLAFLVLTLPNMIFYILNYAALLDTIFTRVSRHDKLRMILVNDVCALLYMANGAVNFYLYCLTGRRFREEFIRIMRCVRSK